jgi:hypothetical protein
MICRNSHHLATTSSEIHRKTLAMTAIGTTAGYATIGLFQDVLLNVLLAELFWMIVAAMVASKLIQEDK